MTHVTFISLIEPRNVKEACVDDFLIIVMQEELNQFVRNNVWDLIPRPLDHPVISTKWVFKNKLDEFGQVIKNKAILVAQGYNQEECINFDETYAPIARLKSNHILLAYVCFMNFKLYQIDLKSTFFK